MSCLYWLYCMYSYNSSPCFLLVTCRLDGRTRFSTLSRRNTYWQCAHWKYVIEYRGRWLVHHHEAFNFGGCLEPPPPSPAKIYIPGSKIDANGRVGCVELENSMRQRFTGNGRSVCLRNGYLDVCWQVPRPPGTNVFLYRYYRLVQVERRKFIPRPKYTPFFWSDHEILYTSFTSPYEGLT